MALSALAFSDLKVESARAASFLRRLEWSYSIRLGFFLSGRGPAGPDAYLDICAGFEDRVFSGHVGSVIVM